MYLDNAATTPLLPEVKDEIIKCLDFYGNPSSVHEEGRFVRKKIEESRFEVAKFINGNADNILFTSSGSAANNLVIHGLSNDYIYLYTPTSHKSMRLVCENKPLHCEIKMMNDGLIDDNWLEKKIKQILRLKRNQKFVLCYEMANSEIGVYQNTHLINEMVKKYGGIIVADATAYIPHFSIYVNQEQADFITFSGHKIGALKGIGVAYYNSMEKLKPLIYGSQEQGLFGGTENVVGIISLGTAVKYWRQYIGKNELLSHYLSDEILRTVPDCYEIASTLSHKVSNIMMFCFKGVRGDELLELLNEDGFMVSTGSACNSGNLELSRTLVSIRVPDSDIPCCIRISINGNETAKEIKAFLESLKKNVERLRLLN